MTKRGWKAVLKEHGHFFSLFMYPPEERSEYIEGETTHRKEGYGPLTCFDTKEQARDIAQRYYGYSSCKVTAVLPCEYEESKDNNVWTPESIRPLGKFPTGTRFADSITILKSEGDSNE